MGFNLLQNVLLGQLAMVLTATSMAVAEESRKLERAWISGEAPGWTALGEADFKNVNCHEDTWTWKAGLVHCTGEPTGVMRSKKQYTNFEFVCQWQHLKRAGNSGIFVWTIPESLKKLAGPGLPHGVEVQVLDLGYKTQYEIDGKRKATWFTCHGDVFPVGATKLTPFPPISPDGVRSFPSKNLTIGAGNWNHYYIRAINGEVRLWVNGEEVSGGTEITPSTGYLCLESEGSPVEFRAMKIRELP